MNWFIIEKNFIADAYRTAGVKARDDADRIFEDAGFTPLVVTGPADRDNMGKLQKLKAHLDIKKSWQKSLEAVKSGDTVVIQFPAVNHSLFLGSVVKQLVKNNVTVTALIHDLELLRLSIAGEIAALTKWRLKKEELSVLHLFSKIIVHNDSMKEYMHKTLGVDKEKMTVLQIFDYLIDGADKKPLPETCDNFRSVIVAGNLNKMKSAYIYELPDNFDYELYGPNYTGDVTDRKHYHGSFPPDELPYVLNGGFGLVWDGTSAATCSGVWGEYLRYNNPHKTSLYLASGIPVVIWKHAALADFVKNNGCGITVESLFDIPDTINAISKEQYDEMRRNAREISKKLTDGYYLKKALC